MAVVPEPVLNGHSEATQRLLERLEEPRTAEALNTLLDNIELIAFSVSALDGFLRRSDNLIANVTAGVNELKALVPPDAPETAASLVTLAQQLPRLASVAPKFVDIIERLEPFISSPEFDAVLDSGVFHGDTVKLVGQAGDAFVESYAASMRNPQRVGVGGLLRALRDADIQRALGLILTFAKRFGQLLQRRS